MAFAEYPIEYYQTKFHQKNVSFNDFNELKFEDVENISKDVYAFTEGALDTNRETKKGDKLARYVRILQYLANSNIHATYPNYDERVVFLIQSTDPELITLKEFLKTSYPKKTEILKSSGETRKKLLEKRNAALKDMESRIREQIGFFDKKLVSYELKYYRKFAYKLVNLNVINVDYISGLLELTEPFTNLDSITKKDYERLNEISQNFIAQNGNPTLNAAAFNVRYNRAFGLTGITKRIVLLILLIDPNLDALRIYEEESRTNMVEARMKERFGYYNPELIRLERIYHDKFTPDMKISFLNDDPTLK